jgi:hypothetical protein
MKISNVLFSLFLVSACAFSLKAQVVSNKKTDAPAASGSTAKFYLSSPAFAEVILRKTELESELESLLISYTEDFPKVKAIRFELEILKKQIERLAAVKSAESAKLTLALGKLLVRKAELETDLWNLRGKYDENHAEVKRAKRKVEIYEASIKEILG